MSSIVEYAWGCGPHDHAHSGGYVHTTPSALNGWDARTWHGEKITLEILWNRVNELEKEIALLKGYVLPEQSR